MRQSSNNSLTAVTHMDFEESSNLEATFSESTQVSMHSIKQDLKEVFPPSHFEIRIILLWYILFHKISSDLEEVWKLDSDEKKITVITNMFKSKSTD